MSDHTNPLHRELNTIREELARMAGMVERAVHQSCEAISSRDSNLSRGVIKGDRDIDLMQNQIEMSCLRLMATQQPVATDLRFLAGAIMVCLFLERIGDQAVNISQRALALTGLAASQTPITLVTMSEIAKAMLDDCLEAIARDDVRLAQSVLQRDDELDELNRRFLEEMVTWMTWEHRLIRRGVEFILASRHLERIGDLATNIAEQVVYLVEGRFIRHDEKARTCVEGSDRRA